MQNPVFLRINLLSKNPTLCLIFPSIKSMLNVKSQLSELLYLDIIKIKIYYASSLRGEP